MKTKTYLVYFWRGTLRENPTDCAGRPYQHNTQVDLTADDIVRLSESFDVGISKGSILYLNNLGSRWSQG